MAGNILLTLISRVIATLIGFLIVMLNARFLHSEGVGTIGLIMLAIIMIQLLNNIISGTLVYLVPREKLSVLLFISYLWAFVSSFLGALLLHFFNLIPVGFSWDVTLLSVLLTVLSANLSILVAQERYKVFNILSILQVVIVFVCILFFFYVFEKIEIHSYTTALYVSYSLVFSFSFLLIVNKLKPFCANELMQVLKQMLQFGFWVQIANVSQMLNYRAAYFLIEKFLTRSALGIYAVGTQLSESVWVVGKSIAQVQMSRISNTANPVHAQQITLTLLKLTFFVTTCLLVVLILIPTSVFVWLFSTDFVDVRSVIGAMAVGILAVSISQILSAYFSGLGHPKQSAIASAIGLVVTLLAGIYIVPRFGIVGAGFTATFAYCLSAMYQLFMFKKWTKFRFSDFLITQNDFKQWIFEIKEFKNPHRKRI